MNNIQLSCIINESLSTHYIIYKITNNINGKYYISQHQTNDVFDDYMGSGKIILEAEDKYGLSAFTKTIRGYAYNFQLKIKKYFSTKIEMHKLLNNGYVLWSTLSRVERKNINSQLKSNNI